MAVSSLVVDLSDTLTHTPHAHTQPTDLGVDPELVEEVEFDVDGEHGRGDGQCHGQVEHLGRSGHTPQWLEKRSVYQSNHMVFL